MLKFLKAIFIRWPRLPLNTVDYVLNMSSCHGNTVWLKVTDSWTH